MDSNINFRFNPRRCEDHLSVFGKKVLNELIIKWKSDQNRARNVYQPRFTPSSQNKRDIITNEESLRPTPPMICQEINIQNDCDYNKSFDFNLVKQHLPSIPTNLHLVKTVQTSNQNIDHAAYNISSHYLIKTVQNDNKTVVSDLLTGIRDDDVTDVGLLANSNRAEQNSTNIDWDDMFDSELFSDEVAITNTEHILQQIDKPISESFNIKFSSELAKETGEFTRGEKQENAPSKKIKKPKRKQQPIKDIIPKKVKKISDNTKTSFRKQKYTKTVNNWLNDVDPNNQVDKDEMRNTDIEQNNANKQAEIVIVKVKEKSSKKVIQAQLANKDGIMKFGKPKLNESDKQQDEKSDEAVDINNENCAKEPNILKQNKKEKDSKEKKNKPKFIVPIKSQIPVKDVTFKVTTVDENNLQDHIETLRSTEHQDIIILLIYSNGFSQLNYHHTEDTCDPEGIFIAINDDYFYFKGFSQNNREILQPLIEINKIICYDGKPMLIYLKSKVDVDLYKINLIDSKIGGNLIDPDSPPENFSDLQKLLSYTPDFTISTDCNLQKTAWYSSLLKECSTKVMSLLIEEQLWNVFVEIEMKLLPIIAEMERRGVSVDLQKLKSMEDILLTKMKSTELECHKAAGKSFQINSTVQVRALIYDELQLDTKCNVKIRETVTKGAKSTSETMLRSLMSKHPLPKLILEYRHLHKAHSTFLTGISQHVKEGIVRPTWVQTAASTGRIASNNPNLQAIPKAPFSLVMFPKDNDPETQMLSFRSVYVAREGYTLLAADFKHVECRVFAHAAADTGLLATLRDSEDLFRVLAHKWLKKPEGSVSAEDRERTKRIVYASLYGAGCKKLMDILNVSYEQALAVIASFNRTFPSLKNFSRSVVSRCEQNGGRLSTLCGRARRFKNISSQEFILKSQAERQAVNFVVQGSAADLCKMAMVLTSEQLRNHSPVVDGYLLLQIHDELVWEIRDQHLDTAAVIIKRVMEGCGHQCGLALSLPVSLSVGNNWGEMKEYLPLSIQN